MSYQWSRTLPQLNCRAGAGRHRNPLILSVPETERGAWASKTLALIERRGTVWEIQRYMRSALHSKNLKDILTQLVEAGFIE